MSWQASNIHLFIRGNWSCFVFWISFMLYEFSFHPSETSKNITAPLNVLRWIRTQETSNLNNFSGRRRKNPCTLSLSHTTKNIQCKMLDSQIAEQNQCYSTYCQEENGGGRQRGKKPMLVPKPQDICYWRRTQSDLGSEKKTTGIILVRNWTIHKCDHTATDDIEGHSVIFSVCSFSIQH